MSLITGEACDSGLSVVVDCEPSGLSLSIIPVVNWLSMIAGIGSSPVCVSGARKWIND